MPALSFLLKALQKWHYTLKTSFKSFLDTAYSSLCYLIISKCQAGGKWELFQVSLLKIPQAIPFYFLKREGLGLEPSWNLYLIWLAPSPMGPMEISNGNAIWILWEALKSTQLKAGSSAGERPDIITFQTSVFHFGEDISTKISAPCNIWMQSTLHAHMWRRWEAFFIIAAPQPLVRGVGYTRGAACTFGKVGSQECRPLRSSCTNTKDPFAGAWGSFRSHAPLSTC